MSARHLLHSVLRFVSDSGDQVMRMAFTRLRTAVTHAQSTCLEQERSLSFATLIVPCLYLFNILTSHVVDVAGYGLGPLLFAPLSEIAAIGRNWVYVPTFFLFVILSIPTALVKNYAGLLVLRFLTG